MAEARSFPLAVQVPVPSSHWDQESAVDLFAGCGTPALAVFAGNAQAYEVPLGGNVVLITADDGTEAYYAHLAAGGRASGRVSAGQVIGYVSDSGNAAGTGCHLHFAVGQINANGGGTYNVRDWLSGVGPASPGDGASVLPGVDNRQLMMVAVGLLLLAALMD